MLQNALISRLRFTLNRLQERLWVKPLFTGVISVMIVFLAGYADHYSLAGVPDISADSIEALLSINTASMLVIAVFTVGSMLSAYTSASEAATPRSFGVVVADDISQQALSTFIAAFIFSVVALTALLNDYYSVNGRFVLFVLIMTLFAIVILRFLRWVDAIARLGRLGTVINKVEQRTAQVFKHREALPMWGAQRYVGEPPGDAIMATETGYVQRIDLGILEAWAMKHQVEIYLSILPGDFVLPHRSIAYMHSEKETSTPEPERLQAILQKACVIAKHRTFDEDPAFGMVVLTEIASRALSPAVNDPGTAISIIRSHITLLTLWHQARRHHVKQTIYPHIHVPDRPESFMFDQAFDAICRDGAAMKEVILALLEGLEALARVDALSYQRIAEQKTRQALAYAEQGLRIPEELAEVKRAARWMKETSD